MAGSTVGARQPIENRVFKSGIFSLNYETGSDWSLFVYVRECFQMDGYS